MDVYQNNQALADEVAWMHLYKGEACLIKYFKSVIYLITAVLCLEGHCGISQAIAMTDFKGQRSCCGLMREAVLQNE